MQQLRNEMGRAKQVHAVSIALACLLAFGTACSDEDDANDATLEGTWEPQRVPSVELPEGFDLGSVLITFDSKGDWAAYDGCNKLQGDYSLADDGSFEAGSNSVGTGCVNGQLPYDVLLPQVSKVRFESDDDVAILEDGRGESLITLERSPD